MEIRKEQVTPLFDSKYIKVYDLEYEPGKHYFDASRRDTEDLTALKNDDEFHSMMPDGIGCCVIICEGSRPPRLLLSGEYRYPVGQFLLSPVSGIIDREDKTAADPYAAAAGREIAEETGLKAGPDDIIYTVNQCLFCSPGFTDDCCALVCAILHVDDLSSLSSAGAKGAELFSGYYLYSEDEVREILMSGRDRNGKFYSVFTWVVMTYFALGYWKDKIGEKT